jgi:DNA-binding XRE family transcriptional regulator
MFSDLLRRDRERHGLSVEQAAWRVGVTVSVYRTLEAAEVWPDWETCDRIERLYGWPRSFVCESVPRYSPQAGLWGPSGGVMFRRKTEIDKKLARGEAVTMKEIVETYTKYEPVFGRMMPTPESVQRSMEKVAEADQRGLLIRDEKPREVKDAEQLAREEAARSLGEFVGDDLESSGAPPSDKLSAANLDDIPEAVRIGSPYDASDEDVRDAARVGFLHPRPTMESYTGLRSQQGSSLVKSQSRCE